MIRRRAVSRRTFGLAQLLLWASAGSASAEVRGLELRWQAPGECPKTEAVLAKVDSHLSPEWKPAEPVRVRAIVSSPGANDWRVALSVQRREGLSRRALKAETCAALADAAALVIALALDPGAARARPDEEPSPEESDEKSDSPDEGETGVPLAFAVGIGPAADTGALPELAWGVQGVFAARIRRVRLDLAGGYFFPQTSAIEGHPTANANFDLLYGRLGACFWWPLRPFSLGPCAGFEVGRLAAESRGVLQPSAGDALWLAVAPGAGIEWEFAHPFSAGLFTLVEIPLQHPNFLIQGLGVSAHRVEGASLRLQAVLAYAID